jgi:putative SOS response-associated peptidase YedK
MCGRYTLISNVEAIRRVFGVLPFDARLAAPRYNIAPTQPIVIARPSEPGLRSRVNADLRLRVWVTAWGA